MEWIKFLGAPAFLVFLAAIFKDALATRLGYQKVRLEQEKTIAEIGADIRNELREDIQRLRERVRGLEDEVRNLRSENQVLRERLRSKGVDTAMIRG